MTGIHPITRQLARKLRAAMTPQERQLWVKLRELNRMMGLHFRRQAPIGPFIADFAEFGRRLVIEVDGGGHNADRDAARDEWLSAQGFLVLRFWNTDVEGNLGGVMQVILDRLDLVTDAPPPHPSPTRGEGAGNDPALRVTADGIASPPPLWGGDGGGGPPSDTRASGGQV